MAVPPHTLVPVSPHPPRKDGIWNLSILSCLRMAGCHFCILALYISPRHQVDQLLVGQPVSSHPFSQDVKQATTCLNLSCVKISEWFQHISFKKNPQIQAILSATVFMKALLLDFTS